MSDAARDTALQNIALAIAGLRGIFLGLQTYATGTFTPGLAFGGASVGMTVASAFGVYTQVGREFICEFSLTLASKGSSTGVASLTGLPASASGSVLGAGGSLLSYGSLASITGFPSLSIGTAASIASFSMPGTVSTASLTDGNFTNNSTMTGRFGFYV